MAEIHTLTEKIITEVKFTLSSHAASAGTRFSTTQAVLRQQTNMGEGFTNDPTTHHYGVLQDPATHYTSEGLSYMTRTTEPQKNSQPKVSLEHYVGHPTNYPTVRLHCKGRINTIHLRPHGVPGPDSTPDTPSISSGSSSSSSSSSGSSSAASACISAAACT